MATVAYIWALAESASRAFHSVGSASHRAHLLHSEYVTCWALFVVLSTILVYVKQRDGGKGHFAVQVSLAAAVAIVGFLCEGFTMIVIAVIWHALKI
jgi:hypothetical protein